MKRSKTINFQQSQDSITWIMTAMYSTCKMLYKFNLEISPKVCFNSQIFGKKQVQMTWCLPLFGKVLHLCHVKASGVKKSVFMKALNIVKLHSYIFENQLAHPFFLIEG